MAIMVKFNSARVFLVCMLVCVGTAATAQVANAASEIRWRSGAVEAELKAPAELSDALTELAARPDERHLVVQFESPVDPNTRNALEGAGLRLLSYLGDNAFFASISPQQLDTKAVARIGSLIDARAIQREWRLHPDLLAGIVPDWAVVSPVEGKEGPTIVGVYVLFHPDVPLATGVNTAQQHGATVRSELWTINGLVIELPFDNIPALADEDVVQWIEPPLPKFSELNNSNRSITGADIVQAAPYGLDGSGVKVLVYDGGYASSSHPDFQGRLTVRDTSGQSDHATHVSGTIGGAGISNPLYKGMAPAVTIESYGFEQEGGLSEGFLYSDPGDLQEDYNEAINTYGAHISNNSIGSNVEPNGFACSMQGKYGVTAALIDSIVRGSLGDPFRIVWADGNERQGSRCDVEGFGDYYSTAPPAGAKNHITVGALNSNDDSVTDFTSWGPVDDGRMKPDLSGPGCQSDDDDGVTSCSAYGGYTTKCGTSMSSPTVCGLSSLLLQDFRAQYPGEPDFRNSTLKVLLAQTTVDVEETGPDYKTGYGSVRIQPAVDLMRAGNFLEAEVAQDGFYSVLVVVDPGDPALKVTIAWDDFPGTPNVDPALVNDLDLVVYDPSGGQHYPWTLDQFNPSAPAVRTQANHKDNIEQVYVESPEAGAWQIEVHGFNVPAGPQVFSLAASPLLVNCSTAGVASLDRAKYACQAEATIQVVDCDLNTDDGVVETIEIPITSDSEPGGEMVLLTETAAETAAFRGTISLDTTDAAGVLHVAHGDLVTATYIDEDDGFGGTNVEVKALAVVDCQAPVISNVQAVDIEPRRAKVTFDTDEPATAVVHYGLACGALTEEAASAGYNTTHSVNLTGLVDGTTYFYAVGVEDEAGNAASDNNGGACYSFETPEIPDFFTEEFDSNPDVGYLTLTFIPNGSYDFYSGCTEPIDSLPTDPTGGTTLSFSSADDGYATVSLTGGEQVSLYGTSYGSFYVGTNGYITFGGSDTDYSETLADHFDMPRISALFDDLHTGHGGLVSWKQLDDRAVVTWEDIPEFYDDGSNTFQIEMYFNGKIVISYEAISADDGIAGLSAGNGLDPDFYETDLSDMGPCGPPDCNNNGVPDDQDIAGGTSLDCNVNLVPDECDIDDGTSPDCNVNGVPDECDLSEGTSPDCNINLIPDECDVAGGASPDCNTNGVPDECDVSEGTSPDCNENAIPDECDVAGGASPDGNTNGIPDECEVEAPITMAEGGRFVAVTPQPSDLSLPVALLLKGDSNDPDVACLSLYVQEGGTLGGTPVRQTPAEWDVVHIHGEEIIPAATYGVSAEFGSVGDPMLSPSQWTTTWRWGDVNGNGVANLTDVLLIAAGYQGDFSQATMENLDIDPCVPNGVLNLDDILGSIDGFQGGTYRTGGCPMPCP
jgi:hypothetical protein